MKKNLILGMFAAAGLLLASSCQRDELDTNLESDGEATVSFSVSLESGAQTRAISDGSTVDQLVYAVYDASGNLLKNITAPTGSTNSEGIFTTDSNPFTDLTANIELSLAKKQTYTVVFWAQDADCTAYTTTDLKAVGVSYDSATNNDESRDAFYKAETITVEGSGTIEVTLKRPFAQINVGVTAADWAAAKASGVEITQSSVTISDAATQINLLTGAVSGSTAVSYTSATIPSDALTVDVDGNDEIGEGETYNWLSMSYILVNNTTDGASSADVDASFAFSSTGNDVTLDVSNIPVQRNYRTNILGKILTGDIDFEIVLDTGYDGDNIEYPVSSSDDLEYVAANGGTATLTSDVTLSGTLYVTADDVEIDKNGYSIVLDETASANNASRKPLTRSDSETGNSDPLCTIVVQSGGSLVINGEGSVGSLTGTAYGIGVDGGTLTINEGNYYGPASGSSIYLFNNTDSAGSIEINGGYFKVGNGTANTSTNLLAKEADATGTISVTGGTFANFDPTSYLAEGYSSVQYTSSPVTYIVGEDSGDEDGIVTITDGVTYDAANKIYYISNANGMFWVAAQTVGEEGTNGFSGYTLQLTDDIDLQNQAWDPIGHFNNYPGVAFRGTFDGNDKTIYNLNTTSNYATGLFGCSYGVIQDLTVDGATVVSNHYAGVISGYSTANKGMMISNCHVKNATVTVTVETVDGEYDNGDKAGGIIGYMVYGDTVDGCSVENTTITAYRDLGGIVGYANGNGSSTNVTVTNNTVGDNVVLIVDGTEEHNYKDYAATAEGHFAGSIIGHSVDPVDVTGSSGTAAAITMLLADGVELDNDTGVYSISTADGMFWFANEVNVNKNAFSGQTVQLTADIDLNDEVWEPIGQTGNKTFLGTFDGDGHTISNLKVEAQADDAAGKNYASGLFGWVETSKSDGVVIQNLNVSGASIAGHHYVGVIAGYLIGATISNCTVTGAAVVDTHANSDACGDKAGVIAGIAASNTTALITGCTVSNSSVKASRDAGQIVGAGYDGISVVNCTVGDNVTVSQNDPDSCNDDSAGNNINERPIGRHL